VNKLVPISSPALPALVAAAGERASMRFLEFFAANIRNPHTRRAYYRRRRNSSPGARPPACLRSPPSSRYMSQPGSRPGASLPSMRRSCLGRFAGNPDSQDAWSFHAAELNAVFARWGGPRDN